MAGALAVLLEKESFKSKKGNNLYRLRIALWEEHTNKKGIAGGSFNRRFPIKAIAPKEVGDSWNVDEVRAIWMKIRGQQNANFPNIWDNNIYIVSVKENTKREERGLYGEVK